MNAPDGHCATPTCDNLAAWDFVNGAWVAGFCGPCSADHAVANADTDPASDAGDADRPVWA